MALTKTVTVTKRFVSTVDRTEIREEKIDHPDAYIVIESCKGKSTLILSVGTYSGRDKQELLFSKSYSFVADMNGPNFIKQGYQYLKTLPEFAGAVDC